MENRIKLYFVYMAIAVTAVLMPATSGAAQGEGAGPRIMKDRPALSPGIEKAGDYVRVFFEPVNGRVTDVDNGLVKVSLEGGKKIWKGMRLSVFRSGRPFYHPVTNELIGETEDPVGRIEAGAENAPAGSRYYTVLKGDIRKGDIVRITSSKVKLAFFQDRRSAWELSEEFYGALKDSGRFEILEAYTPSFGAGDLSAAARELGAEAFLVFSTPLRDRKRFVNVRLYWAEDTSMFGEFEDAAGRNTDAASMPVTGFLSEDIDVTQPLTGFQLTEGKLIAAGDVDGNGSGEIIVSDGRDIRIYNLKDDGLNELWQITGAPTERHLSIDVLDMNNNGIAEIFVTSLTWSGNIGSYVLEYDHAGYIKIGDGMPYFLRVDGKSLFMQKSSLSRPFIGPVYEGEWKDGGYGTKRPLDLPAGVNVFGFTYIDWQNKGLRQLISYDDSGHLTLYDENGAPLWKSETTYGISGSFNRDPRSISDSDESVVVRGGLQTVRTERGQELIVVKRIPNVSLLPGFGFKGCEVYSLWWNGASMEEKLVLKDISGTATDYRIDGGKMFMFVKNSVLTLVKNAVSGEFYKGSVLYFYDFGVK